MGRIGCGCMIGKGLEIDRDGCDDRAEVIAPISDDEDDWWYNDDDDDGVGANKVVEDE